MFRESIQMWDDLLLWWKIRRIEKQAAKDFRDWHQTRIKEGRIGRKHMIDGKDFARLPYFKKMEEVKHLRTMHLTGKALEFQLPVPGYDKLYKGEHFSYLLDTDFVELRNAI
jgi:hypothetical protein